MPDQHVQRSVAASVLCWLATVDQQGQPNVSPKELFTCIDNKILIAHIASPQSVRNIAHNPRVCVSFIDLFKQKGHKVKGKARLVHAKNADYARLFAALPRDCEQFPIRCIIEVTIDSCTPIIAPSYALFADTTEASMIAAAMRRYGVRAHRT